jgi:hypothetical protein
LPQTESAVAPWNEEAEEKVLGSCLISPAAVTTAVDILGPSDFYLDKNAAIFGAIRSLHDRGDPVETIVLAAELERQGTLASVGGKPRLAELSALVPAASNVAHYASLVLEAARSRAVYTSALAVQKAATNGGLALHPELIDRMMVALEASRTLPGEPGMPQGPVFLSAHEFTARRFADPEPLLGTTDMPILTRGGFNLLAGRPGAGKTTLIMDMVCHLACGLPWPAVDETNAKAPSPWPVERPLNVALIVNEGPQEAFRQKLADKLDKFPHDYRECGGQLLVQTLNWGTFSFADRITMQRVRDEFDQHQIDLVVGDPLSSLGLEGVGSPAETLAFVQLLAPLGLRQNRAFLFLHHFRERVEKGEDELARISGAWGGHIDTLLSLAGTHMPDQLRFNYAKIRWAKRAYPPPIVLGKVYNTIGFEAIAEEGDTALLEPKIAGELSDARAAGRGRNGWETAEEIRSQIQARRVEVKKALEGAPHLFTSVTGETAKAMGAKSVKAILWGLVEWGDAARPTDDDHQQSLDDAASSGSPQRDPDEDIPF